MSALRPAIRGRMRLSQEKTEIKNPQHRPADPTSNADRRYRNINGIKKHPLWHQLTSKQQNFLIAYIETLDRVQAVEKAGYEFSTEDAAELHATRLLSNFAVKNLLAAYFGYELQGEILKKEEFLRLLSDRLRNPHTKTSEFVVMARITSELMLGKRGPGKSRPTNQSVDDLVQAIEKARKESEKAEE